MAELAVTSLKLSHFRSYALCEISCDTRPIAIFGPNGAGKTNLLEALSMLSPGRGMRRARTEDMARAPQRIGWRITAQISADKTHDIVTGAEAGGRRTVEINGKSASQIALARILRMVWLVPSMDRLWLEGAGDRRQFVDRVTMSFDPAHAERVLVYEKAMRERNRLLKDQIADAHWYNALEAQMAQSGGEIIDARAKTLTRLAAAQDDADAQFPKADLAMMPRDDAGARNKDRLREALGTMRARDLAAGRSLIGPHRDDLDAVYAAKDTPARLCSTGEQKALLVSLILANARAIAQDVGAPPLVLLDEVAAHLDADRRAALYDEICALGAQAWMTGTEASLFEGLEGRATFLEAQDGTDGTRLKHTSP